MIDAAIHAFLAVFQPAPLVLMLGGVAMGLIVGIIPGMGGTVGMSLLLPFIYGMEPSTAFALLIGMVAVVHTADTFPSVLLGVPGSSGSQATILDGYPLAQQGEASRALGAAFFASMVGGLAGAAAIVVLLPVARPLILALGSPELFMLAMLGLSMVGVLSGARPMLGVLAGLLGLLAGTIGAAPAAPAYRYTFDVIYLFDGIPLPVVALGLFAVPELWSLLMSGRSISHATTLGSGWLAGIRDVLRQKWLAVRCSVIGVAVGFVPGLGGAVVDWISYGHALQSVPDNSKFGHGDIRGVIAPESSNNAKEGGALIPTLLFGIPGSGTTAVLLGGFVLLGLQPGPSMLSEHLATTYTIVWTLAIANVVGAIACLVPSPFIARLSLIPATRLAPFLFVVLVLGAYQSTASWGDVFALLAVGYLGWAMRSLGIPRPPFLIGFVLAANAERYLWISASRYGWHWLTRPGVIAIALVIVLLTMSGIRLRRAMQGGMANGA